MAAAGRRWQRCSSCGCRLMSASGQRPCCPSHGRGHHLPGRSTSIRALWRTAWLHESACWAVAVERWARRGATRRRKGLFQPFVRYLTHLDLATAKTGPNVTFACSPRPLPPWGPRRLAGVHIPSLPTGAVRAAASASPVSPRRLHSWRSAVWAIWADVLVRSEDGLVTTLLLIRRVHLPSEPRPLLEQPPAGASRAPANTRLACLR